VLLHLYIFYSFKTKLCFFFYQIASNLTEWYPPACNTMMFKLWNTGILASWLSPLLNFREPTVFLHAHLQVVYHDCVKFHKNSISSLVGVVLTRYMPPPPPFRESISWIISPFKFWTATIFLHAHLQVVYYKCVKFHKNPIRRLGGVALTRYMDGRTDRVIPLYPPKLCLQGV
jgi:hypothetical protein